MIKPIISEMENFDLSKVNSKVEIIKSICPINMSILIPKAVDNGDDNYSFIGRVTWLCKTVFDNLFCITSNYVAEDESDEESLVNIPFLDDKNYVNFRIASDMLMGTLPHYLTDLEFYYDSDSITIHNTSDTEIYCVGIEYNGEETIYHKITVSPEVFGVLKFMDRYIMEGVPNIGNLRQAILTGPIEDNETSLFVIDKIEVLDLAPIKKHSSCAAIKMKVSHISKNTESYTLLVPFDLGQKYRKKKFGKSTIDTISDNFLSDENNYVDNFAFTSNLNDKDYLFLRCQNCNKDSKLFAMPHEIKIILIEAIENYTATK